VNEALREVPADYVWGDASDILRRADLAVCNLECVISDKGEPWSGTPKAFYFRSDAKNVESLTAAGIGLVSLANNHTLDFGEEALADMLGILEENGIRFAGAGGNEAEARRPAIIDAGGFGISFFSLTDNEPEWRATEGEAGTFYLPIDADSLEARGFFRDVEDAGKSSELVVVSVHWGPNWGYSVPDGHIRFAHALVDRGAGLVVGHSPHVFRGIEIYRDRPILYSAGDFIDDYAVDEEERNDESFVFEADIDRKSGRVIGLKLYPTLIRDFRAVLAQRADAWRIAEKMRTLCGRFRTRAVWSKGGFLKIAA
jgi:poly-gamma-glutamate capsule biosynthesis protein CapA/YwtB (metallophosphatase superfamily)